MSSASGIEEQAALWVLRREDPFWSASDQEALDAWLGQSAAHKAAYWRLQQGWRDILAEPDDRLVPAAPTGLRRWIPAAAAASLAAGLVALTFVDRLSSDYTSERVAEEQFETSRGERKLAALADGSTVELNTASSLRTAVGGRSREVWLDRGEAFFSVTKRDGARFVVHAGERAITVLGTKFNVRRDDGRLIVSVVEGRVMLQDANGEATGRSAIVMGGDTAIVEGSLTTVTAGAADRVRDALAWRDGMLIFDRITLSEAAAEFNRYNKKPIIVTDAAAAGLEIGGTFKWSNVDAFARLLGEAYGLRIEDDGRTIKISSR